MVTKGRDKKHTTKANIKEVNMTVENRVSIVIPPDVKQSVLQKLTEVDELLKPFLIALKPEERKVLPTKG